MSATLATLELLLVLAGPALGGALLLHLWQTRPQRSPYVVGSLTVGQLPLRVHKRAMANRRAGWCDDETQS